MRCVIVVVVAVVVVVVIVVVVLVVLVVYHRHSHAAVLLAASEYPILRRPFAFADPRTRGPTIDHSIIRIMTGVLLLQLCEGFKTHRVLQSEGLRFLSIRPNAR